MKVYQHSSKILKTIIQSNQGFKTVFYEYLDKNQQHIGSQTNKIYSITINTYKQYKQIENAINQIFPNEQIKEKEMLMVLIYEGVIAKQKIKIGGKLSRMVKDNIKELESLLSTQDNNQNMESQVVYLRPNKHKFQVNYKIIVQYWLKEQNMNNIKSQLVEQGYKIRKFGRLQLLRIQEQSGLSIATHQIIKDHLFIIQDISSCLPVLFLREFLKSKQEKLEQLQAIDSTSAPGNKSLQLSEFVRKVYSFEKDEKRFKTLSRRVQECEAINIQTINQDFLEVDPQNYEDIEIIICDPSCSGSGMKLHNTSGKQECTLSMETPDDQSERARNLGKFQFKILSKALTQFPSVKYVAYSTCSIYKEENEQVVNDVLRKNKGKWKAVNLEQFQENLGIKGRYAKGFHYNQEFDSLRICRNCGPKNYLNGFFLTIFEKI